MPLSTEQLLERSRKELLDLSTRNRLLSIPIGSTAARVVQVEDELSDQVFRLLVTGKKSLSFLPGRPSHVTPARPGDALIADPGDDTASGLPQPDDDTGVTGEPARRHVDSRLQTSLSPEGLQTRLLTLFRDAQTMIEEQGVNILYLALGHLQWLEAGHADQPRHAPLVLIPVEIRRKSASEKFHIRWLEEDVQENLSLRAKLKADFDIDLPGFPDEEDFDLVGYFDGVAKAVAGAPGWGIQRDAVTLGFFSFAKFLMFRDLDPKNWPEGKGLLQNPFLTGLLQDGFPQSPATFSEATHLDELIPVTRLDHVVDADSSQSLAIEAVRQGRSIVIQGPPGTGKSQSIANIIATAVLDGKKVLFVAEKLAALEVVKRRLKKEGLGDVCLELHSNKSHKRAVVEEIGRTWKLGRPKEDDLEGIVPNLEHHRGVLNAHAHFLHERQLPCNLTPYQVIGHLTTLGEKGQESAGIAIPGAETWTPENRLERSRLVRDLGERLAQIGLPSSHPWRGAGCDVVLHLDLEPLAERIRSVQAGLKPVSEAAANLAAALSQAAPETLRAGEAQRRIAAFIAAAPPLDRKAFGDGIWETGLDRLKNLVTADKTFAQASTELAGRVTATAWAQDLSPARTHLAAQGESWFRFLNGDYRRALAELRGLAVGPLPKPSAERLALADRLITGQRALHAIRDNDTLGQAAFGTHWQHELTDWAQLDAILDWAFQLRAAGLGETFRRIFAGVPDPARVGQLGKLLAERLTATREAMAKVFQELRLDCAEAFHAPDPDDVPWGALAERCSLWLSQMESLPPWNRYFACRRQAREKGVGALVDRLETGTIPPGQASDCLDRIYFVQLLREFMKQNPALAAFDGAAHERWIDEFRGLDRERLTLSKSRILRAHVERMPPLAGIGAAGIVSSEMERKRGHKSVRRLLRDAGSVVQAIKPVFLMSPLSVAQFLEPGAVEFDLLVMDEASQIQPVDALGAIARCRQVVVVGDSRQLPPTRFFTRMTSDDSEPEDDGDSTGMAEAKDIESILGLCCARGLPQTLLRWHYRSRHHSLIAVSNHEFYEDRLFIVPSPHPTASGLGLRFHHVPEGVFDSGASGTNRIEARVVCRAVVEHARQSPGLSLGVAAFSVRQQQAILDELEILRRENPGIEAFFAAHQDEPFFVKNLENVQGDERDVIFISVGYARNAQGYMAMRFGPLSTEGGERRLNVLISRAKLRCEVFSSIEPDDIDLERASGRGVAALKVFLHYARTGLLSIPRQSGREEDSPFEEAVCRSLESLGHEVHAQVGIAGFFIDLAVRDPDRPGHYIIGIECDGAAYHSSRSARDRDRLRQAVLVDHGWTLHRIWSTDWFQRPAEQLLRVRQAIENALEKSREASADHASPASLPVFPEAGIHADISMERETGRDAAGEPVTPISGLGNLAVPYVQAHFPVPTRQDPHEISTAQMADIVTRVVRVEGPIHEEEIVVRVRDLWGLGRAGNRVQDSVLKAVQSVVDDGVFVRDDGFLSLPGTIIPVRNRQEVASASLRKPEMLPPAEIRAAILVVLEAHHGATAEEIPMAVSRVFGFKSTGPQLRAALETQLAALLRERKIEAHGGMLRAPRQAP